MRVYVCVENFAPQLNKSVNFHGILANVEGFLFSPNTNFILDFFPNKYWEDIF